MIDFGQFIHELWEESQGKTKCPHIAKDDAGCYCGNGHSGGEISAARRMVCDSASLQLWCLCDKYTNCQVYKNPIKDSYC